MVYLLGYFVCILQEEHDGVVADVPQIVSNSAGDDDLTSLTWLQDKNLLKSKYFYTMTYIISYAYCMYVYVYVLVLVAVLVSKR